MATHHTLTADAGTVHRGTFDASLAPVFTVASGDTIEITSLSGDPPTCRTRNPASPSPPNTATSSLMSPLVSVRT